MQVLTVINDEVQMTKLEETTKHKSRKQRYSAVSINSPFVASDSLTISISL